MKRTSKETWYDVILLDRDGQVITSQKSESLKEARTRARHYLSDKYAFSVYTTHGDLDTERAQIWLNGECLFDEQI
jgi:hypothetical protein